jgi:hypothetical protein
MATFRIIAVMLAVAGSVVLAHAQGCDSPYPWLCKPVPSIDPPETAEPSNQPAAKPQQAAGKPLPIAARSAGVKRSAKTAHAAQARKRSARKAAARNWALRARHAKIVAARAAAQTAEVKASKSPRAPSAEPGPVERPTAEPAPAADGATGPTTGFTAMWTERTVAEPTLADAGAAGAAGASGADATHAAMSETAAIDSVPADAAPVASQDEANEIDLAAPEPATPWNGSWLRGLFLAFGGLVAVGSALRLFL